MARETKSESESRIERENAEHHAQQLAAWSDRMMKALGRATVHGMDLTVADGMFQVAWYDSYNDREVAHFLLTPASYNDWNAMVKLERALDCADRREEEYRRKQALRASALSKLSREEREELGL
jgi:hypothetical protein